MLSYHLVSSVPLLLVPFTVPWIIVFAMTKDPEMWPYHLSFRFFTMVYHHALQLHSGFCCEPPCSSHGLRRKYSEVSYSISSQGLESFFRFLDLKLRKPIVDLDLIDKDRIYKWKGALTRVEITEDRTDHEPHLSLLSLSHISWTFIFNFQNDDLPRILGNRALFGQNVFNSWEQVLALV